MAKRLLAVLIFALLFAVPASAQLPGHLGLFTDDTHSESCFPYIVPFYPVEFWIWCLPGENGVMALEFMLTYPPNIIQSTVTINDPIITVQIGTLVDGWSVAFAECQNDWFWAAKQMIYNVDDIPSWIDIVKHPADVVPCVQCANCLPQFPTECLKVFTKLGINMDCPPENPIGVEETTWGAIKSLYR